MSAQAGAAEVQADELWRPARSTGFPLPAPEQRLIGQAMAEVYAVTGQLRGALTEGRRGTAGNPARWVAAWWLERAAGLSQVEVAALLEASPVLVSRWIRGLKTCEDERVQRWMRELERVKLERVRSER